MSMKRRILPFIAAVLTVGIAAGTVHAQQDEDAEEVQVPQAKSLDELLDMVQEGVAAERARHQERIQEFIRDRERQQQLLQEAKQELAAEERRSDRLEKQHSDNDIQIAELENQLNERMGEFGEIFGVLRQVSGDLQGIVSTSVISAQYPNRGTFLSEFAQKKSLPEISEIEKLWYELQREMTASGKVVQFPATVITAEGQQVEKPVVRVGAFNAVADGRYLDYQSETGKLVELPRQPAGRFLSLASRLEEAREGRTAFGIDPSRGSILSLLVQTPSFEERIGQGGIIGYIIIGLGIIGVLLSVWQFIYLLLVSNKVRTQMKRESATEDNPLGRVLRVYEENRGSDVETLELKLDEAILRNTPPLERFLTIIKVLAVVAPLLGLLGTVTGMINTFQAITLFGTGDPKLMAGGISQALVTTMLGLTVAIPLTFLHTLVAGRSRSIIHILEEQSAGIVAVHAERNK